MKKLWWLIFFILIATSLLLAQEKKTLESPPTPSPIQEEKKAPQQDKLEPIPNLQSIPEEKRIPEQRKLEPIPGIQPVTEQGKISEQSSFKESPVVQPVTNIPYQVQDFNDFKGGLNLSAYKTKLPPPDARDLENALWNPQGEIYKRPGYSLHSTAPEPLNFDYRFYKQCLAYGAKDTCAFTMGGSDTALYFCAGDSTVWHYLIGTGGVSGRWDGATFNNLFIGTHEGIVPVLWDGDSLLEIGISADSFKIIGQASYTTGLPCAQCSASLSFREEETGWESNIWEGYMASFPVRVYSDTNLSTYDTLTRNAIILGNTANKLYLRFNSNTCYEGQLVMGYAKIYSWFQVDTIWREGTIDSAITIAAGCRSRLWDNSYTWDSTFNYSEWLFEVVGGEGTGIKTFLVNNRFCPGKAPWNTGAFIVEGLGGDCFDSTTTYRIYKLTFVGKGAKFVEVFDGRVWLGWTGLGTEQNKNEIVFSEPNDVGNFPPDNQLYLNPGDGDYITAMKSMSGEYVDVPRDELLVWKNASFYKIVPEFISGEYYPSSYTIANDIGCVSNSAVAVAEGVVLFPNQDAVWAWDRARPQSISKKIDPICKSWDKENLEDMSAVYNPADRHYYLSANLPDTVDTIAGRFITLMPMDSTGGTNPGQWIQVTSSLGAKVGDKSVNAKLAYATENDDIASDTSGNYAIIWTTALIGYNLRLAMFDSLHNLIGDTLRLNDSIGKVKSAHVSVDINNRGKGIACWEDTRNSASYSDVVCQQFRFTASTVTKAGSNFYANDNAPAVDDTVDARHPSCAINDDSVVVIVWDDGRNANGHGNQYGNIPYKMKGTFPLVGSTTNSNALYFLCSTTGCTNCNTKASPDGCVGYMNSSLGNMLAISDSTYVVVGERHIAGTYDLYFRLYRLSNDSVKVWDTSALQCGGSSGLYGNSVSMNKAGYFVIVYAVASGLAQPDISFRKYDPNGSAVGSCVTVTSDDSSNYADVALDNKNFFTIVWQKPWAGDIMYRAYSWDGAITTQAYLHSNPTELDARTPKIDLFKNTIIDSTPTLQTYAWNIDYHGWSKESFDASAYCYQHSIWDSTKILFASGSSVYMYATQADDIDQPVILTYQTGYYRFAQFPSFSYQLWRATVEAEVDAGYVKLNWYKDYGSFLWADSVYCTSDCFEEFALPDTLRGQNVSMKLTTGLTMDEFTLSRIWWELVPVENRR